MRYIASAYRRLGRLTRKLQLLRWRARGEVAHEQLEVPSPRFNVAVAEYRLPIIKPDAQAHLFDGKMHNLRLALQRLQGLVLDPGACFSFWHLVGRPTAERGFEPGPSFLGGKVTSSPGGGLCQLSGLLYNLALLAGCRIHERHPHSIDAYGAGRYVPLGRDATVAYGFKDLRFRNALPRPLLLDLEVTDVEARGSLWAAAPLPYALSVSVTSRVGAPQQVTTWRTFRLATGKQWLERMSSDVYRPSRNP